MITIVLPVLNEELVLEENTLRVFSFCKKNLDDVWQIILSDNGSTDKTAEIGCYLAEKYEEIEYFRFSKKGKGYGVMEAWKGFPGNIYVYMDIDLSTDLIALPELIAGVNDGFDIVVGSRFMSGAKVERSLLRRFYSNVLRLLLKIFLGLRIKDAPCGFKAVNRRVIDEILPNVENKAWFFDTEMLVLSQKLNMKIKEIPVKWQETIINERKSKVGVIVVVFDYIKNIFLIYDRK